MLIRETSALSARRIEMDRRIRKYFDGCNEANAEKIISCLTSDAVHYFPPGMYGGPFRSAHEIAAKWCSAVQSMGSYWCIDRLLLEPVTYQAAMEWTHYKTSKGTVLRGIEWYEFDETSGLISEIRAYYASPQDSDLQRLELAGFDYPGRHYSTEPPPGTR